MVAHGARSLFVKLLDMKMWDGFLEITISVIWSGQRENLLSFATASGFFWIHRILLLAGNHDQKRISNLPPDEPNWILIVFVIADKPSTIPSSPTSFVEAQSSITGFFTKKRPCPAAIVSLSKLNKRLRKPDWGNTLPVRGKCAWGCTISLLLAFQLNPESGWTVTKGKDHLMFFPVAPPRPCCDHTRQSKDDNLLSSLFIYFIASSGESDAVRMLEEFMAPRPDLLS